MERLRGCVMTRVDLRGLRFPVRGPTIFPPRFGTGFMDGFGFLRESGRLGRGVKRGYRCAVHAPARWLYRRKSADAWQGCVRPTTAYKAIPMANSQAQPHVGSFP